jgi:hypothetical protein
MKAKRQNRTLSVSATMLDGSGGHVTGSIINLSSIYGIVGAGDVPP